MDTPRRNVPHLFLGIHPSRLVSAPCRDLSFHSNTTCEYLSRNATRVLSGYNEHPQRCKVVNFHSDRATPEGNSYGIRSIPSSYHLATPSHSVQDFFGKLSYPSSSRARRGPRLPLDYHRTSTNKKTAPRRLRSMLIAPVHLSRLLFPLICLLRPLSSRNDACARSHQACAEKELLRRKTFPCPVCQTQVQTLLCCALVLCCIVMMCIHLPS